MTARKRRAPAAKKRPASLALKGPMDRLVAEMLGMLLTPAEGTKPTDYSKMLRKILDDHGLSQRGTARELGISERTMRRYVAGELPVPRVVSLALAWVILSRGE